MSGSLFSPRGLYRALTPADRIVVAGVLVVAFVLAALAHPPPGSATHAIVIVGRGEVADVPLGVPGVTRVRGKLGPVTLEVAHGAIRVKEAGCPHRICVAMGAKHRPGEILVCAPNELLVRLEGGRPDPGVPDAVSR
jgi:hypothetical protein